MTEDPPDLAGLDARTLLSLSARWLTTLPDVAQYLSHMAEHGPGLFAEAITDEPADVQAMPAKKVLRADAPQFFRSLGWTIASTMPLPALGWKPHRLTPPGRNEPCLCGSGRKFKHCCQRLIERAPRLDPVYLGAVVVQTLPASDRAALPTSAVHPDMVAAAAHEWMEEDRPREALRLLEPWGRAPAPWPRARVELLDLLADLYLDLGHPRKRKTLAQAMVDRGDAEVQSLGWQRLSMMAADRGDIAEARSAFERAQRLTPDDPRVALLEVTTLLGSGDLDRAHERAAFHARRLARLPQAAGLAPQIEGLQAIARGEMDHLARGGGDDDVTEEDDALFDAPLDAPAALMTVFDELKAWVGRQPPARLRLDLSRASPQDLGELCPDKSLHKPLQVWRTAFQPDRSDEDGLQALTPARWQPLLQRSPALLDSFEVLDDLIRALDAVPMGLAAGPQAALLARAMDLWTLLRERFPAARCEWGWLDNRPALRLLTEYLDLDPTPRAERSFEWLRALVEVLNPRDNHGLRERLGAVLLRRGDAAAALALAERYPDDFVGIELIRTRALLALQRLPEAEAAYAGALRANAHVVSMLQARRAPRPPQVHAVALGSIEQAQQVVSAQHDLWRDRALQGWLKSQGPDGDRGSTQLTLT
jgi:tetratricopeptide (TPR) repeat protein